MSRRLAFVLDHLHAWPYTGVDKTDCLPCAFQHTTLGMQPDHFKPEGSFYLPYSDFQICAVIDDEAEAARLAADTKKKVQHVVQGNAFKAGLTLCRTTGRWRMLRIQEYE